MPGGGFTAGLSTDRDPLSGSVEFLASQNYTVKRGGVTIDASTVPADDDGNRIVKGGTALGMVTESGKYGPVDAAAVDGRADATGLLFAGDVEVSGGDTVVGLLIAGSVLEARCTGVTEAVKSALGNHIIFQ